MNKYIPEYLRNITETENMVIYDDSSYDLTLKLILNGVEAFTPYICQCDLTEQEIAFNVWVKEFKKRYKYLWDQGYNMTSTSSKNGIVFGCTKDHKFSDLEIYNSPIAVNNTKKSIVIKVLSSNMEEVVVFNSLKNGYEALISDNNDIQEPKKFRKKSKCKNCHCDTYRIYIDIHNTGEKDLLLDLKNKNISLKNFANAFDWFAIDLECSNCGKRIEKWFEIETM